jgi:hypothetical protein
MKTKLRFDEHNRPAQVVLIVGLILASASFWFPKESVLHGAGGGTIGIVFVFFALSSPCTWLLALCSVVATSLCMIAGFGYSYFKDAGKVFSVLGAGFALIALAVYLVDRLRSAKRGNIMQA